MKVTASPRSTAAESPSIPFGRGCRKSPSRTFATHEKEKVRLSFYRRNNDLSSLFLAAHPCAARGCRKGRFGGDECLGVGVGSVFCHVLAVALLVVRIDLFVDWWLLLQAIESDTLLAADLSVCGELQISSPYVSHSALYLRLTRYRLNLRFRGSRLGCLP